MTKLTLKTIDTAIALAATTANKANDLFHEAAMMVFRHAAPKQVHADCSGSGDCTRALKIVRAMPASYRRTMMIEWFRKNTPIVVKLSDNGDKCEYSAAYKKMSNEDKLAAWDIENANTEAFFDIAEATPEEKPFDLSAMVKFVEGLSKRVENKIEKGAVPEADLETAQRLVIQLGGIRVQTTAANEEMPEEQAA